MILFYPRKQDGGPFTSVQAGTVDSDKTTKEDGKGSTIRGHRDTFTLQLKWKGTVSIYSFRKNRAKLIRLFKNGND
jgi:hypothetical protein